VNYGILLEEKVNIKFIPKNLLSIMVMYSFVKPIMNGGNMTTSLNFFKQYHSTVIKALGEDAKKVNAKVGSIMADNWADRAGKMNSNSEFAT